MGLVGAEEEAEGVEGGDEGSEGGRHDGAANGAEEDHHHPRLGGGVRGWEGGVGLGQAIGCVR